MLQSQLRTIRTEMEQTLTEGIIPFWLERSVDETYGGYLLSFDRDGKPFGNEEKYIVTQSRMVWGFSHLLARTPAALAPQMRQAARQGAAFLIEHFWDKINGGFVWRTARDGSVLDGAKLTYGESFAIYALSEYYLVYGDEFALDYAKRTFDLLGVNAADTANGGYFENIESDWTLSGGGSAAGDRKSLDIHMHLLEAFTTLAEATGTPVHLRRLAEIKDLILTKMVNAEAGYGYNQFDVQFNSIPAINIDRTWNADRETGETIAEPAVTTSYGHNVELSWLMDKALRLLGQDDAPVLRCLLDHALAYGCDREMGGIYRDGIACESALVRDKEWWQNFESLVGFLNGYLRYGDARYFDAFSQTWAFIKAHFLHPTLGESYQLLDRAGNPLVDNLGNPWKGIYHTGRALSECLDRLDQLIDGKGE